MSSAFQTNYLKQFLLLICFMLTTYTVIYAGEKEATAAKITIIIDDVGDSHALGLRATRLPHQVALSILPFTPFSKEIATLGHQKGMNILLHQPMESLDNLDLLGPGALLGSMERQEFARTLEKNLDVVPFVIGLNNHMGSLLTTNNEKMNWLMAELKQRDIFFIDSRTTTQTVAAVTAKHWQIPTMSRKVFLDHYDDPLAIAEQFERLIHLAEKFGHATAIGHPRKNTLDFLERELSNLAARGVTLVSASDMMISQNTNQVVKNIDRVLTKPAHFYDSCYNRDIGNRYNHLLHTLASNVDCSDF